MLPVNTNLLVKKALDNYKVINHAFFNWLNTFNTKQIAIDCNFSEFPKILTKTYLQYGENLGNYLLII